jgi:uncharacterized protein YkwD
MKKITSIGISFLVLAAFSAGIWFARWDAHITVPHPFPTLATASPAPFVEATNVPDAFTPAPPATPLPTPTPTPKKVAPTVRPTTKPMRPTATATPNPLNTPAPNPLDKIMTKEEADIFDQVNQARAASGLNPLIWNAKLQGVAYRKVSDMIEQNYFGHAAPDGRHSWYMFAEAGVGGYIGENLAAKYGTKYDIVKEWMLSPKHRENILDPHFVRAGLANRNKYWAMEFAN